MCVSGAISPFLPVRCEQGSQLADKLLRANFGKSVGFTSLLILVRTAAAHTRSRSLPAACMLNDFGVVLLVVVGWPRSADKPSSSRSQVGTVLQMRRQILAYAQKPALEKIIAGL